MKKLLLLSFFASFIVSCTKSIPEKDLPLITGYWGINEVTIGEEKKVLPPSVNYDYFFIDDNLEGFRKKVALQFNKTFATTKSNEALKIKYISNTPYIIYKTANDEWKEEILFINESELRLMDTNGTIYTYQRFEKDQ